LLVMMVMPSSWEDETCGAWSLESMLCVKNTFIQAVNLQKKTMQKSSSEGALSCSSQSLSFEQQETYNNMNGVPLNRWQSNVLSGREPEGVDVNEHHQPAFHSKAEKLIKPFSVEVDSHCSSDAFNVEGSTFGGPSSTSTESLLLSSTMEPHWNAIQQVTAPPVLPPRSPHDQLDTHAPEGDLFRQKNPLMRIRLFSWDDGKCAQVPASLSTQSATGLQQQHKPQQQQQQLFEEQSQQRIPQPHMLLQQTLPSQAQQEWTNGGDSVVAPIEFETTLLFKASQPACPETHQYSGESLVEQLHRETGMDIHNLQTLDNQGLLAQIPRNEEGEICSIGSTKHDSGECSPCLFWFKKQCAKGLFCDYCHFRHKGQRMKRIRPSKKTRMQMRMNNAAPVGMVE